MVFYNGEEEQPDRQILKLSELYAVKEEVPKLEMEILMLNVNQGHNPELMEACHTLWEYAEYTGRVRKYAKDQPIAEAVERAITECIREGVLREFLEKNRREAKNVSIMNTIRRNISDRSARKPGKQAEKLVNEREKR